MKKGKETIVEMKKAILIATVIAVCLTLALSLTVSAAKPDESGPAEKATGSIYSLNDVDWYLEFNAHEEGEIDGVPVGKGTMTHWTYNDPEVGYRLLEFEVKYVDVDGDSDMAWFAGQCISDTKSKKVDHWVFVEVEDVGEPGIGSDKLGWRWPLANNPDLDAQEALARQWVETHESTGDWFSEIDEGNLQIHTR